MISPRDEDTLGVLEGGAATKEEKLLYKSPTLTPGSTATSEMSDQVSYILMLNTNVLLIISFQYVI